MENEKRDFKGVWIPKEIWLNTELSAIDKCLLTEINSLDNDSHCWASNKYFAEFLGVSESTVTRSIKKLEELKLITVEMKTTEHGSSRIITMNMGYRQNDERGVVKMTRGVSSNCLSNNIQSNNIDNIQSISKDIDSNIEKTEYESHMYSPNDFLGSTRRKPRKQSQTLYDKCILENLAFTQNIVVQKYLDDYLRIRLNMKDKPIYGVNQWKGMLNKLHDIAGDNTNAQVEVIMRSIERGWASFFESSKSVVVEADNLSCEQAEDNADERAEKLKSQGRRAEF